MTVYPFSLNLKQRRARKHHVAQTEALDCVLPGNLTPAATARASNVIVPPANFSLHHGGTYDTDTAGDGPAQ